MSIKITLSISTSELGGEGSPNALNVSEVLHRFEVETSESLGTDVHAQIPLLVSRILHEIYGECLVQNGSNQQKGETSITLGDKKQVSEYEIGKSLAYYAGLDFSVSRYEIKPSEAELARPKFAFLFTENQRQYSPEDDIPLDELPFHTVTYNRHRLHGTIIQGVIGEPPNNERRNVTIGDARRLLLEIDRDSHIVDKNLFSPAMLERFRQLMHEYDRSIPLDKMTDEIALRNIIDVAIRHKMDFFKHQTDVYALTSVGKLYRISTSTSEDAVWKDLYRKLHPVVMDTQTMDNFLKNFAEMSDHVFDEDEVAHKRLAVLRYQLTKLDTLILPSYTIPEHPNEIMYIYLDRRPSIVRSIHKMHNGEGQFWEEEYALWSRVFEAS